MDIFFGEPQTSLHSPSGVWADFAFMARNVLFIWKMLTTRKKNNLERALRSCSRENKKQANGSIRSNHFTLGSVFVII
jgi:hypothetical protein